MKLGKVILHLQGADSFLLRFPHRADKPIKHEGGEVRCGSGCAISAQPAELRAKLWALL